MKSKKEHHSGGDRDDIKKLIKLVTDINEKLETGNNKIIIKNSNIIRSDINQIVTNIKNKTGFEGDIEIVQKFPEKRSKRINYIFIDKYFEKIWRAGEKIKEFDYRGANRTLNKVLEREIDNPRAWLYKALLGLNYSKEEYRNIVYYVDTLNKTKTRKEEFTKEQQTLKKFIKGLYELKYRDFKDARIYFNRADKIGNLPKEWIPYLMYLKSKFLYKNEMYQDAIDGLVLGFNQQNYKYLSSEIYTLYASAEYKLFKIKKMDDIIFSYPERERIINMLLVYLEKAILHNRYNGHAYYLKAWLYKELLECIYDEDEEKEYLRKGRSAKKSAKKYLAKERNYPKFEKKQRYYSGIPGR